MVRLPRGPERDWHAFFAILALVPALLLLVPASGHMLLGLVGLGATWLVLARSQLPMPGIGALVGLSILLFYSSVLGRNIAHSRASGLYISCQARLAALGRALPEGTLTATPTCPSARKVTYGVSGDVASGRFTVFCGGLNHAAVSVPPGYPQYSTRHGIVHR